MTEEKKATLALAIIAKDEVEKVQNIIDEYGKHFDEISVAVDDRILEFQELSSPKVNIYPYEWRDDFSHKRNFLADHIHSTHYFRLDTDDLIENPDRISVLFKEIVARDIDVFYTMYDYAKDPDGHLIARHWRETIIKKRTGIYWKKPIHENVFMENKEDCRTAKDGQLKIIHDIDADHAIRSFKRNFKACLDEFKQDGENTDPRTMAYLGRMLMAKGDWQKAILFLEKHIEKSGWDDDKYFSWVQLSQCHDMLGQTKLAIACCQEALDINTKFPDAYLQMGAVYLSSEQYDKAVDWLMPGIVRPEPDTVMVLDPSFYGFRAHMNAAMALLGKGDVIQAVTFFEKAKKIAPNSDVVKKYEPLFREAWETHEYINKFLWLGMYTRAQDPSKVSALLDSIPTHLFRDERIWQLRNRFVNPRKWGKNEVAIYCGGSWEQWSPASTLRGIGGSEEAVIYLSRELVKLGYKVTVYNNCGDLNGIYEGVEYRPYQAFNANDTFNILISWRGNVLRGLNARKRIVWMHDVPLPGMFTEESVRDFDHIIVLSEYHRSLLPACIPSEKVFVSANGINTADFKSNGVLRDPKRLIYTSSYDRGLEHLLALWPEIRQEVPDVHLHVFYGWNCYDEMVKSGHRDPKFKERLLPLLAQKGITEHGRVGHKQLVRELQKSGVWVYPCHFEEISCISAMKAQACGCVPVCTNYAALAETVKVGVKTEGSIRNEEGKKRWKEALVGVLKNGNQEEVSQEAQKVSAVFGWDRVARSWHEHILGGEA